VASIKTMNFDHLVGLEVGTARLLKQLGKGSMAVVFTAYQKTLKRQIAVKILPKKLLTPKLAEMFSLEAEAAAFLAHPGIIPVYEMGETDAFLFFTMQLVKGQPLTAYIRQAYNNPLPSKKTMPIATSLNFMIQILEALDYAHGLGVVHRDIKPANILIESHSRRPIVADFGVARSYAGAEQGTRILVGTPTYMAPEQIVSSVVDGRADIYAAGVMLFQLLCGRLPYPVFDSPTKLLKIKLKLRDRLFLNSPSQLNPKVDSDLEKIVYKAVAFDKKQRFETGLAFSQALKRYLEQSLEPD